MNISSPVVCQDIHGATLQLTFLKQGEQSLTLFQLKALIQNDGPAFAGEELLEKKLT